MKCPKCGKEINDQDVFCGFCGSKIELSKKPVKKKNKKIGVKIFMFFSIMAMLSGIVLGFFVARGIIDIKNFTKKNEFQWTDWSEAAEPDTSKNESLEKEEQKSEDKELMEDNIVSEEDSTQGD